LHAFLLIVDYVASLLFDDVLRSKQLFIKEMIKGVAAAERKGRGPNKVCTSFEFLAQ
jgi:hypothetical protein